MSKKMKVIVEILALALMVSVGFNLVNNFVFVPQAQQVINARAQHFAATLSTGFSEPMCSSISAAIYRLSDGLDYMFFGNISGSVSQRSLDQTELSMTANLTDNLDGLLIRSAPPQQLLVVMLDYSSDNIGMDPAQQLQKVGVNMTSVLEYINQITQISFQLLLYY
jgi:hypothetical protein